MKNILVVGASSGIGKQLAVNLAEAGHKVFGTYRNTDIDDIATSNLEFHYLDVMEEDLDLSFLPDQLDGFVYCPGSIKLRPFSRIKAADFSQDFNLQVLGGIKVLQTILPKLKSGNDPSVLLFSTVAVSSGFPFHAQVSASKGAIEGLSKALAAEFAPKIRVNCIAPSLTDTPLSSKLLSTEEKIEANAKRHPLKRIGSAQDIAAMAEFLLSEKASWITGQIFMVDGGMSSLKI